MKNEPDSTEIARKLRDHISDKAKSAMPPPVNLSVYDGSRQMVDGYVWAFRGDKRVQVLAPGPTDVSAATINNQMVVWALPPNPDDSSGAYTMIGYAVGGTTGSRAPALITTGITIAGGGSAPGSGTVTSVGLTMPSPFSVSGTPVTGSGVLGVSQTSAFVETQGGTGQSGYTKGDVLYASGTNTLAKLAIGTAGWFLKVVAGVPAWAAIFYQTIKKAGSAATQRSNLNFIDGTNITITVADDVGNDATNVTIDAATGGGSDVTALYLAWRGLK